MAPTAPPAVCVSSLYLRLSPPEPQVRVHWPQELQAPHWHSEPKPVKSEQSEEIETSGGGFPEPDGVNNPLSLLIYGEALARNKESFGYESKAWNWVIFCRNTNVIWGEGIETAIFYNQHLGGETGLRAPRKHSQRKTREYQSGDANPLHDVMKHFSLKLVIHYECRFHTAGDATWEPLSISFSC